MGNSWQVYLERLDCVERMRQSRREFLARFWIWRPYPKHSLGEQQLREQGYENLNEIERNNQ